MTRKPTPLTAGLAVVLLLPAAAALAPNPTHAPSGLAMQTDLASPLWGDLQALGLGKARWADLLTGDADGNGRSDFLDLTVATAAARGLLDTRAELLAYGPADAIARIEAAYPGAVSPDGLGATFLTARLSDLGDLQARGATLLAWEPRAYTTDTSPCSTAGACLHRDNAQAPQAATLGYDGSGVTVAILDTGITANHDAFSGKTITWTDCAGSLSSASDPHGHGSHVASIATGNDGSDYKGVATGANVWSLRVLDASGSGSLAYFQCAVNAIRDAKTAGTGPGAGPIVASASLGLGVPPLGITTLNGGDLDLFGFDHAADLLPIDGIPFTVAAGNWIGTGVEILDVDENVVLGVNGVDQVSSPGFANQVITVGAVTDYESRATFSALGPGKRAGSALTMKPDIMAHGFDTWGANAGNVHDYIQLSGTSMATPGAAGIVAILLDKTPTLTPAQVKQALHDGADNAWLIAGFLGEPLQPDYANGYGLAKAANSLALV
jgi:subtilisin family serine protease